MGWSRDPFEDRLRALGDQIDGRVRRARRASDREMPRSGGPPRDRPLPDQLDARPGGDRQPRRRWSTRRRVLVPLVVVLVLALVVAGGLYAYLQFRYDQLHKVTVAAEVPVGTGQPFNLLVIGSDSRLGARASTGVGTTQTVSGQRSDVIMVWHVVPATKQITILSIPRDTLVQMVGSNVGRFGRFNRINAAYNSGADLLVQTIQANFGIQINHVVEVNFAGFKGAVDAVGGIYMNFKYPAKDAWSGLDVTGTGCQLLDGTQALAVARSRHYQYEMQGQWIATPIGDLGRIKRQDAFLRALVDAAKREFNPFKLNSLLGSLPQGIVVDSALSLTDLLRIAVDFHSLTPSAIRTYTLPTSTIGAVTPWGDVLFVQQPADQQLLVGIFGNALVRPSAPPPDTALQPQQPPAVTSVPPATGGSQTVPSVPSVPSTSATPHATPTFDPSPCVP